MKQTHGQETCVLTRGTGCGLRCRQWDYPNSSVCVGCRTAVRSGVLRRRSLLDVRSYQLCRDWYPQDCSEIDLSMFVCQGDSTDSEQAVNQECLWSATFTRSALFCGQHRSKQALIIVHLWNKSASEIFAFLSRLHIEGNHQILAHSVIFNSFKTSILLQHYTFQTENDILAIVCLLVSIFITIGRKAVSWDLS